MIRLRFGVRDSNGHDHWVHGGRALDSHTRLKTHGVMAQRHVASGQFRSHPPGRRLSKSDREGGCSAIDGRHPEARGRDTRPRGPLNAGR
jgi:hypothetical protein